MNNACILLVDDEHAILQLLETVLRKEGFASIDKAHSAEEAIAFCEKRSYDLIVLDVALPGMSGIEACPFIRRLTEAPILFLSARTTDFDKLTGFAVGGDDYVTKPFNPLEIVARARSLLRRSGRSASAAPAAQVFRRRWTSAVFGSTRMPPNYSSTISLSSVRRLSTNCCSFCAKIRTGCSRKASFMKKYGA